jgi:hypothetical protein
VDLEQVVMAEILALTRLETLVIRNWKQSQFLLRLSHLPKLKKIIFVKPQDIFEKHEKLNGIRIEYEEEEFA